MLFESRNGKQFIGWPITEYRYNLEVGTSCYAVRMVLDNEEEYVLGHCGKLSKCKYKCSCFNKSLQTKTHCVKVTRLSDTKYEYEVVRDDPYYNHKSIPGNPYCTFEQKKVTAETDEFAIGYKRHKHTYKPENAEEPDEFTIGASYYVSENGGNTKKKKDDEYSMASSFILEHECDKSNNSTSKKKLKPNSSISDSLADEFENKPKTNKSTTKKKDLISLYEKYLISE